MLQSPDLYLGTFLVLSGFALSLLNLRRIMKKTEAEISAVLLSENLLLMCIGMAFISRAVYEIGSASVDIKNMERSSNIMNITKIKDKKCDFKMFLMSYGPLIVSLVNSFLSLIIDNYMHLKMIQETKIKEAENEVQEIGQSRIERKVHVKNFFWFWKKYFSFIAVALQWIVPVLTILSMYPVGVEEKTVPMSRDRNIDSCITMLEMSNQTCFFEDDNSNFSLDFRKYVSSPNNYFVIHENAANNSSEIDSVLKRVYNIVTNVIKKPNSTDSSIIDLDAKRDPKSALICLKMCFIENKQLLIYMFLLAVVSYFVPITMSTIILTKIHLTDIKRPNIKTYVTRELMYNILFWTPVMFDTFLSLLMCSYTMNGARTSLFNVVANMYQAMKNFMNTKYFKDNAVVPL